MRFIKMRNAGLSTDGRHAFLIDGLYIPDLALRRILIARETRHRIIATTTGSVRNVMTYFAVRSSYVKAPFLAKGSLSGGVKSSLRMELEKLVKIGAREVALPVRLEAKC